MAMNIEKSYVSITAAAVVIAAMAGGIVWLSEIRSIAKNNQDSIETMEYAEIRQWKTLGDLNLRLSRIEGKLDLLLQSKDK